MILGAYISTLVETLAFHPCAQGLIGYGFMGSKSALDSLASSPFSNVIPSYILEHCDIYAIYRSGP